MNDEKQITFIQHETIPLKPGKYHISVTHEIEIPGQDVGDPSVSEYRIEVKGEPYHFDEGAVHSLYPPANRLGNFGRHLPHIVLNKPGLPWERSVDPGNNTETDSNKNKTPWLTLLVFDENDPPPEPKPVAISELRNLPEGTFHPAETAAQAYEYSKDPKDCEDPKDCCTVIDVPLALFEAIAPTLEDLGYLAHVREVSKGEKPLDLKSHGISWNPDLGLLPTSPEKGEYAVIIANRLPGLPPPSPNGNGEPLNSDDSPLGFDNVVHLVSLEGFGEYLPDANGNSGIGDQYKYVRLVSLKSWNFATKRVEYTLTEVLKTLDRRPAHLQVPEIKDVTPESPQEKVNSVLARGYTGLTHYTRRNDRTVSWYRGPLLPYPFQPDFELEPPETHPDAALHYDRSTGMFDVSYAAAWQLGRLLALHDMNFATTLLRWRRQQIRSTQAALQRQQMLREFHLSPPKHMPEEAGNIDPLTFAIMESLADRLTDFLDAFTTED